MKVEQGSFEVGGWESGGRVRSTTEMVGWRKDCVCTHVYDGERDSGVCRVA